MRTCGCHLAPSGGANGTQLLPVQRAKHSPLELFGISLATNSPVGSSRNPLGSPGRFGSVAAVVSVESQRNAVIGPCIGVQNQPGTVLLTISDMSVVEAEMEIDETSIPSVALGQKARVHVDAYPNRTFDGTVTEVGNSPIAATTGGTEAIKFKVKVRIDNPPEGIKPGLSVQADLLTGFRGKALTVPIQALVVREDEDRREREGIYVVEDGKVAFRALTTGLPGELSVEVLDGVKEGETIVTGPFRELRSLKPGDAVREAPPERDAPRS